MRLYFCSAGKAKILPAAHDTDDTQPLELMDGAPAVLPDKPHSKDSLSPGTSRAIYQRQPLPGSRTITSIPTEPTETSPKELQCAPFEVHV